MSHLLGTIALQDKNASGAEAGMIIPTIATILLIC